MRTRLATTLILGVVLLAAEAPAQGLIWKWLQPWTCPWTSHESRVVACTNRQPLNHIALDDWICGATGPLVRVWWWGTLTSPAQGFRPYYLAIYAHQTGACLPNMQQRLFETCVVPDYRKYVGTDCANRRVYRMSAVLPTAATFFQQQGTHYWLQISEADQESIQPNFENFRWSAHRPINLCEAVSFPPLAQPIFDQCDNQPDDLAFGFSSRDLSGVINPPPGLLVPPVLQLELYDTTGTLRETVPVEVDDVGNWNATPEISDGMYRAVLRVSGALRMQQNVQLMDGTCTRMSFFDVFYGDLDGDAVIGLSDLTNFLSNYGRMAAP